MAITAIEYSVLVKLKQEGLLPPSPAVLDLGEQNWYGDVSFKAIEVLANETLAVDPDALAGFREDFRRTVKEIEAGTDIAVGLRRMGRLFYRAVFTPESYLAVDYDKNADALQHDLNLPLDLDRQFDVVANIGTAEHVFDIARVFRTVHQATAPGGLMIHTVPFNGWWDHGFYSVQPTLFFDLAASNGYEMVLMTCGTLKPFEVIRIERREDVSAIMTGDRATRHVLINCVLRKGPRNADFAPPIQGIYAGRLSQDQIKDWKKNR